MKKIFKIGGVLVCLFLSIHVNGQDRIKQIETQLKSMIVDMPGLEEKVELSVNGVSIQEFIRGIGDAHKLNISIDPGISLSVVNNFSNATVTDVLLFICKEYDLSINFIGSIISIVKFVPPTPLVIKLPERKISINYISSTDKLTLDLKNDSLDKVAKIITQKSKKNVVLASGVGSQLVSTYIEEMPFESALEKFAFANNLVVTKTEDNFYLIDKKVAEVTFSKNNSKNSRGSRSNNSRGSSSRNSSGAESDFSFDVIDKNNISIYATDVPINEIIQEISKELKLNYYLLSDVKDKATISVENISYDELLNNMMQGTEFTYKINKGIYIIGERKEEGLRLTKVLQLQHRTVENIIDLIPSDLMQNVNIQEFADLNSLILSGSELRIKEIETLLIDIDKVVPVILIEVMIVDYSNKRTNIAGIEAGIGDSPSETGGKVFPEISMGLGSATINDLINSFNGYGIFNLGKVTSNFYLNIKALESQGILRVKSTPKLATLNGHEASMSIGETEYYFEETNNVITNNSTQNIRTKVYKSVNADLSITIRPFVSGDDQITLEISVTQSDFTGKIEPGAPPGSVSRNFTSLIRVKNQEMILLGGLEEKKVGDSGSGVPFLSRIPVIKWFFSNRSREKSKSKLNIFIKPTVIY